MCKLCFMKIPLTSVSKGNQRVGRVLDSGCSDGSIKTMFLLTVVIEKGNAILRWGRENSLAANGSSA